MPIIMPRLMDIPWERGGGGTFLMKFTKYMNKNIECHIVVVE
jgi:hypothetical protein